jgi:GNAT superfamily N-acetyltransferase
MTIRIRRHDDVARCVGVLATVHAADSYPLFWPTDPPAWLTPVNLLSAWVAEDEGDVLGHVALCSAVGDAAAPLWSAASTLPAERLAVVAKLFVAPHARGRGVGARLLAQACAEAHRRSLRPALEVLAHDQRAIALYERAGWRRVASVAASWARTCDDQRDDHALLHYYLAPD